MNRPFSSTADKEFGDSYIDISQSNRRLVRVTTKTYATTGTYLFIKLFKKGSDGEFYIDQRVTLSANEFHHLIGNVENIDVGTLKDEEPTTSITKREKCNRNSKTPKLSCGSNASA